MQEGGGGVARQAGNGARVIANVDGHPQHGCAIAADGAAGDGARPQLWQVKDHHRALWHCLLPQLCSGMRRSVDHATRSSGRRLTIKPSNALHMTNRPTGTLPRAGALLFGIVVATGPAGARESVFRNWMAVCDNALTCTAFGFSAEKGAGGGFIKITREAAPSALLRVELAVAAEEAPRAQHRLSVTFDGPPTPGLPSAPFPGRFDDEYVRVVLAGGRPLEAFVAALTAGTTLTTVVAPAPADQSKPAMLTFAIGAAKEALAWVDEQQGRGGTATALVAKGAARGQTPAAVGAVRLKRVGQVNLPKAPPANVAAAWLEACPGEANDGADGSPGEAMRVDTGMIAWRLPCGSDHMVFLADERAGSVKQLSFKLPTTNGVNDVQVLQSATFNAARMSLTAGMSVDCTPNLGQIGYSARWLWSNGAFELVDYKAFLAGQRHRAPATPTRTTRPPACRRRTGLPCIASAKLCQVPRAVRQGAIDSKRRSSRAATPPATAASPSVPNLKFASYGVSSCLANFKFEKHTRINFF